jgi:hypothetical protein
MMQPLENKQQSCQLSAGSVPADSGSRDLLAASVPVDTNPRALLIASQGQDAHQGGGLSPKMPPPHPLALTGNPPPLRQEFVRGSSISMGCGGERFKYGVRGC